MQEETNTDKCFAYLCNKEILGVAYKGKYYCLQHLKMIMNVSNEQ